jgi:hypothetical protein
MARKKKHVSNLPDHWSISDETRINGRLVTKGTELSFKGVKGRFRFMRLVTLDDGRSWLDVYGGPAKHEMLRSFGVDRVKTVHRITKTRENS